MKRCGGHDPSGTDTHKQTHIGASSFFFMGVSFFIHHFRKVTGKWCRWVRVYVCVGSGRWPSVGREGSAVGVAVDGGVDGHVHVRASSDVKRGGGFETDTYIYLHTHTYTHIPRQVCLDKDNLWGTTIITKLHMKLTARMAR